MANNGQAPINTDLLKLSRIRAGFTYRGLSLRCAELGERVDHKSIAGYERGQIRPTPAKLLVLARALGIEDPAVFLLDAA